MTVQKRRRATPVKLILVAKEFPDWTENKSASWSFFIVSSSGHGKTIKTCKKNTENIKTLRMRGDEQSSAANSMQMKKQPQTRRRSRRISADRSVSVPGSKTGSRNKWNTNDEFSKWTKTHFWMQFFVSKQMGVLEFQSDIQKRFDCLLQIMESAG